MDPIFTREKIRWIDALFPRPLPLDLERHQTQQGGSGTEDQGGVEAPLHGACQGAWGRYHSSSIGSIGGIGSRIGSGVAGGELQHSSRHGGEKRGDGGEVDELRVWLPVLSVFDRGEA